MRRAPEDEQPGPGPRPDPRTQWKARQRAREAEQTHDAQAANAGTDEDVLAAIRAFAAAYEGGWRWRWLWSRRPARNCRTFQLDLFRAVGIAEQPALLHTHGSGCPVLFPVRERLARWRLRMNGSPRARQ